MSEILGTVAAKSLLDARLQLHWAAQIVSAMAEALLPKQGDDGHSNMEWLPQVRMLAGNPLPGG